jgi:Ca2+-transporting ATPase
MDDKTGKREYSGLSEAEAPKRLERSGPNRLVKPREVTILSIAKEEIAEPIILLLLAVGFVYTLFGGFEAAKIIKK